jgi:hypothetical protein
LGIEFPIGLGPGAAHSWAFSTIENTELDAAEIGDPRHKAIQSVDFPNQMALSKTTNGRITRHSAYSAKSLSYDDRLCAHTSRRSGSFAAGVAAANHHNVEWVDHQDLGWRVLAEVWGGVKITQFMKCFT